MSEHTHDHDHEDRFITLIDDNGNESLFEILTKSISEPRVRGADRGDDGDESGRARRWVGCLRERTRAFFGSFFVHFTPVMEPSPGPPSLLRPSA